MKDVAKPLAVALILALGVAGCRFEWVSGDEPQKDLVVLSTIPANRQTNVNTSLQIQIRTSNPLDPEFVVDNSSEPWKTAQVILVDQANALVPVTYSFAGEILTLTPQTPLAPQSTYGVALRPGVRDIYGENIKTPYAFTFSTGSSLTAIPNWPPFPTGTPGGWTAVPGTFTITGQLNVASCLHRAVRLDSGKVLVVGGVPTPGSQPLRRAEIYDPSTQTWTLSQGNSGQGMFFIRVYHTAVKLLNGHVLVTGGFDNTTVWDSVEEYDPLQDSFSLLANTMQTARYWHTSVVLPNGNPMVLGGVGPSGIYNTMEILDLRTGSWVTVQTTIGGTVLIPGQGSFVFRGHYAHESLILPDGAILSCGGYLAGTLDIATLYWPSTNDEGGKGNALLTGTYMTCQRDRHTATLLQTGLAQGIVVVIGGERDDYTFQPLCINSAEVYDHNTTTANPPLISNSNQGTWAPVGRTMSEKRCNHTASLLANGRILVAGGFNFVGARPTRNAEIFDPFGQGNNFNAPYGGIDLTGTFDYTRDPQGNQTTIPNLFTGVALHTATTLVDGRVLLAGGNDEFFGMPIPLNLCWLYNP